MASCPCGSEKTYAVCCEPYLKGEKKAATAELLMRSRYTAFVNGDIDYIKKTVAPEKLKEFDEKGVRDWSQKSEWHGLEIRATEAGAENDDKGTVEFVAHYSINDTRQSHHEIAQFRRHKGTWYFVDGTLVDQMPYRRPDPKVGRNDPCPCGSGKKYKKCCADKI